MENSIILNVNLYPQIGGSVRSVDSIKNTILLTNTRTGESYLDTREIVHTNRALKECIRATNISGIVITDWINGKCPSWERPYIWRKMSKNQRIQSFVNSFDEGFGVSYKIIDDGEV